MPSTFINPVVNPDASLGVSRFDETAPLQLYPAASSADLDVVIQAVYRQVLGNAYVMDSERLVAAESKLANRQISVREFVRQVAQSDLYRDRFFSNGPRYRAIELNFKHLLGRAPESAAEMAEHSQTLDQQGFAADIDSYLDTDEYQNAFGEDLVPYYRGHKTQAGRSMAGFSHFFQILRGPSSSDKSNLQRPQSRLNTAILRNRPAVIMKPSGILGSQPTDINQLLANVLRPTIAPPVPSYAAAPRVVVVDAADRQLEIANLRQQLAELRPMAAIGAASISQWQSSSEAAPGDELAKLQSELADARRWSAIADSRLNKWRRRSFKG